MSFKATAPGSLMLLGEHAVLHGQAALVCAVDKRISVQLKPRADDVLTINSELFGYYQTSLKELEVQAPYQFVLAVIKHFGERLRYGCDISITAEFDDQLGLGSSAAVTVATFAAIVKWQGIRMLPLDMVRQGRIIVRSVQGKASGADIAAAVYGGMVAYQTQPVKAEKLNQHYPLTVLYSGYKTPTAKVIEHVDEHFSKRPELLRLICQSIGQTALEGIQAVRKRDWHGLGEIFNIHQGLQAAMRVSNTDMQKLIDYLNSQPDVLGAKISGSGLGDCVVGLGKVEVGDLPFTGAAFIPVQITQQGVTCEKI